MVGWWTGVTIDGSSLEFIDSPAMDKIEKWRGKWQNMQSAGELQAELCSATAH